MIDRDSVLTAAHCALYIKREIPARRLRIVVGPTVLNGGQGQARKIGGLSDISIHPRYRGARGAAYDAAVIALNRPVSPEPIKLATVDQDWLEKPGRKAHIAGWGNEIKQTPPFDLQPDSYPNRMRKATVPLVSDAGPETPTDPPTSGASRSPRASRAGTLARAIPAAPCGPRRPRVAARSASPTSAGGVGREAIPASTPR